VILMRGLGGNGVEVWHLLGGLVVGARLGMEAARTHRAVLLVHVLDEVLAALDAVKSVALNCSSTSAEVQRPLVSPLVSSR